MTEDKACRDAFEDEAKILWGVASDDCSVWFERDKYDADKYRFPGVQRAWALFQAAWRLAAKPTIIEIESTPIHIDFESTALKYRTDVLKALDEAGAPLCPEDGELMSAVDQINWLASRAAKPAVPEVLFDGYAVLQALSEKAKARTSPENVSDVLDAAVKLIRAAASTPPETAKEPT